MLVFIIGFFVVVWLFFFVVIMIGMYYLYYFLFLLCIFCVIQFVKFCYYGNSVLNFVVYVFRNSEMIVIFCYIVCVLFCKECLVLSLFSRILFLCKMSLKGNLFFGSLRRFLIKGGSYREKGFLKSEDQEENKKRGGKKYDSVVFVYFIVQFKRI